MMYYQHDPDANGSPGQIRRKIMVNDSPITADTNPFPAERTRIYQPPMIDSNPLDYFSHEPEDDGPLMDYRIDYKGFLMVASDLLSIHSKYAHESYSCESVMCSNNMLRNIINILPGNNLKNFCDALEIHYNDSLKNHKQIDNNNFSLIQRCELVLGDKLREMLRLQEQDMGSRRKGGSKQGEYASDDSADRVYLMSSPSSEGGSQSKNQVYPMLSPREGLSQNKNWGNIPPSSSLSPRSEINLKQSAELRRKGEFIKQNIESDIENQSPTSINEIMTSGDGNKVYTMCSDLSQDKPKSNMKDTSAVDSNKPVKHDDRNISSNTTAPKPSRKVHNAARVMAPEKLPEGFAFEATLGDKVFIAIVPKGGVEKGEIFESPILNCTSIADSISQTNITVNMQIPRMRWRDGILNCLSNGCHPIVLNSLFCPAVALAQIMKRMRSENDPKSATKNISARTIGVTALMVVVLHVVLAFYQWRALLFHRYLYYIWIPLLLADLVMFGYFFFMVVRTRKKVREMFYIPTACPLEDIMCATFCTPCVLCQMGRHTADYETYNGRCCTDTGLPPHITVETRDENICKTSTVP